MFSIMIFIIRMYYGQNHPLISLLYLKLAKIFLFLKKEDSAKIYLKKATEIMKITHGTSSRLFRKELVTMLQQVQV